MEKLKDRRQINLYVFLFAITYMISYITRINYGAVISEMQSATGFSKSLLSVAVTGSFITYGAGQIVSGVLGDKISPKRLVTIGLILTVVMNFLIPICQNPYQMAVVWSVNGFAQSFMWPPIVKIMSSALSAEEYSKGVTKVSWGSSAGTIIVYLISPLLIHNFGWRAVFVFSAIMGSIMIVIWNKFACDVKVSSEKKKEERTQEKRNLLFVPVMIFIMVAIVLMGMLRDGATTWMPSYISDTYKLSNEISILTTVIIPIASTICFSIAAKLYATRITNPMVCAGLFFGIGALSSVGLSLCGGMSAGLSIVLFALLIGCMHSVNLILVCMLPNFFEHTGKVSTASGVLNSCTYIGSAVSTYGIAVLSDMFGWGATISIWLAIAVGGTAICFVLKKPWQKYKENL